MAAVGSAARRGPPCIYDHGMDLNWGLIATVFVAALGGGGAGTAAVGLLVPGVQDEMAQRKEARAEERREAEQRRQRVKAWRVGIAHQSSANLEASYKNVKTVMRTPFLGQAWYRELEPYLSQEARELARTGMWEIGGRDMLGLLDDLSDEVTIKAKEWGVE